jgi:mRNA interferase MazF
MVRGDVHAIDLPRGAGRVQGGPRFAVIVQSDRLLSLSTVAICPTSKSGSAASFHPEVEVDGERTSVLCEMIRAFDASKLGRHIGHLTHDEIIAVDEALELVLDLGV